MDGLTAKISVMRRRLCTLECLRIESIFFSRSAATFEEAWKDHVDALIEGEVPTFVISRDKLIKNKLAAGREQDLLDVKQIQKAAAYAAEEPREIARKPIRKKRKRGDSQSEEPDLRLQQMCYSTYDNLEGDNMLYRVIVRVSYTNDTRSVIRNTLLPLMLAAGLQNTATGTWESDATEFAQAADSLAGILNSLGGLEYADGTFLKHVWIYIDRPRPSDPNASMDQIVEDLLGPEEN